MMKKLMIALVLLTAVMTACNTEQAKYGQGGVNAAQFVKEETALMLDEVENIEVVEEDSLPTDIGLTFGLLRAANMNDAHFNKRVTTQQLIEVLDSFLFELNSVENCWKYGLTNSNKEKYRSQLRKVYTVEVMMKSGVKKSTRVLMERDGITPNMIEKDFENKLYEYARNMMDIYNSLY